MPEPLPTLLMSAAGVGVALAVLLRQRKRNLVDLLRQGKAPDLNRVEPGDVVNEKTGWRERLDPESQQQLVKDARKSLEKMIELTEAARS